MKEYPIILDDEELEILIDMLEAIVDKRTSEQAFCGSFTLYNHKVTKVPLGVLKQLEILKAQNEEDYGS